MRKAIIVGPQVGSVQEFDETLLSAKIHPRDLEYTLKVGVDGGVHVLAHSGWKPNFAVGDWDSLRTRAALKGIMTLTLPKNKDRSDLYYATRAAISVGATDLICIGVSGGRADHHLAMLLDLSELADSFPQLASIVVLAPGIRYHFLSRYQRPWRASLPPGQTVSIFALGTGAKGVTLQGFEYGLKNAELAPSSCGLSNRVMKPGQRGKNNAPVSCSVSIKQGRVVAIELLMTNT